MTDTTSPAKPEKFVAPPEWRARCEIKRLNAEAKAEFFPLHADFIKSLLSVESIDFILYFAVGWDMYEFIRPKDFTHELVKELIRTHKAYPSQTRVCVKKTDLGRYEVVVAKYLREKFVAASSGAALAMEAAYKLYAELSSVSQIIVRGSMDEECYNRVARAASRTIMQMCSTKDAVAFLVNVVGKDPSLYDHGAITAFVSGTIAWNVLQMQKRESKLAVQAGLLHDIERHCVYLGKPAEPTQLSLAAAKEIAALKASGVGFHDSSIEVMQQYRERFDGNGFPKRLKGAAEDGESLMGISKLARIVAIGCAFSEYMLKRQEKLPLTQATIVKFLSARGDSGEFDPVIVKKFIADIPTGKIRRPADPKDSDGSEEE